MSRQSKSIRAYVLATSSAAVLAGVGSAPAVFAQDEPAAEGERIVVTGSRIQRRDFQANSPIVTVDTEAFESQTGVNVESYLNRLPQFNPALSPEVGNQDVQPTANNSVGISTVSLRGLGANRNLVLVDGRRQVPINALMVTDVNSIPSALIQRVEIITGGASAVYGADAVGGVVNFILRDNFEGLEVDAQYGMTEASDGEQFRISAIMGANTADGRGNVTAALEHYSRSAALQSNREFYTDAWADPYVGTNEFFPVTHGYQASFGRAPSVAAVNALFAGRPTMTNGALSNICTTTGNCAQDYNFNPSGNGQIWVGGNGTYRFDTSALDGANYAYTNVYQPNLPAGIAPQIIQSIKSNNEFNYVSSPQDRYSMYLSGRYNLTDSIEFFGRATFAESDTATRLFPSPAITGWAVDIPYNPSIDSPIDPGVNNGGLVNYQTATQAQLLAALTTVNANFRPHGASNAHFPITPELALLLNSRNMTGTFCDPTRPFGQPNTCYTNALGAVSPSVIATQESALWGTTIGNRAPWQLKLIPDDWFDDRSTVDTNTVWQLEAGLRGELPFRDWNWEAFVTHGESSTYNVNNGNFSLQRYQGLIAGTDIVAPTSNGSVTTPVLSTSYWDYGRGAVIQGNPGAPNNNFGAATATCTSGFYETIFGGDVPPSENCEAAINATLQGSTRHQQNVAEVNFQGSLFELPAGEVRTALGVQYRENAVQYNPDILQSTASFIDQVVGVYPTAYMDASTYSEEAYAELLVPVLANLPLIQEFSLELGARYSNYAQSDDEWTYKALADWQVTDWVRLRGGYNRATRAPNIGELFLGRQQFFGAGGAFGDPCGLRSNSPFGAGGAANDPILTGVETNPPPLAAGQTTPGATSAYLICQSLMGTTGTSTYYANDQVPLAGGGFAFLQQEGNANLDSEIGDTWTFGGVINSPFDNPWLSGFTASVDWYQLEITDAIQQQTVDQARFACYGATIVTSAAEAAAHIATGACANTGRNQVNGGEFPTLVSYSNQAHIETSGVDVAINWTAQFEDLGLGMVPGGLGVNVQASFLESYKTKASEASFDVETEWKGSLGPTLAGTNPGAYDYRLFTTLNYFVGPGSVSLRWRHLPEVDQVGVATQEAIIENNRQVVATGEGLLLGWTPTTAVKVKDYDIFDLSGNWQITDLVSIRAGVDNVFDVAPNRTGESAGRPYNPALSLADNNAALGNVCANAGFTGTTAAADIPTRLGCTNPFGFSLPNPSSGTTSAGYYDNIGRRFFVGVKLAY